MGRKGRKPKTDPTFAGGMFTPGSASYLPSSTTSSKSTGGGSQHVTQHTDGAHVSYDVDKSGNVSGWHGTIHDTTGKGENIIVERKSDQK